MQRKSPGGINLKKGDIAMAKESGWPQTVEIGEIDGIVRPEITKQALAVAAAWHVAKKRNCEYRDLNVNVIAAYLNAIGSIHGPRASNEFSGKSYASFGIRVLTGESTPAEIRKMSNTPESFMTKNLSGIKQAGPFFEALFKRLGDYPANAPESPANEYLRRILRSSQKETTCKSQPGETPKIEATSQDLRTI